MHLHFLIHEGPLYSCTFEKLTIYIHIYIYLDRIKSKKIFTLKTSKSLKNASRSAFSSFLWNAIKFSLEPMRRWWGIWYQLYWHSLQPSQFQLICFGLKFISFLIKKFENTKKWTEIKICNLLTNEIFLIYSNSMFCQSDWYKVIRIDTHVTSYKLRTKCLYDLNECFTTLLWIW